MIMVIGVPLNGLTLEKSAEPWLYPVLLDENYPLDLFLCSPYNSFMEMRIGMIGVGGLGHLQANTYAALEDTTVIGGVDVSEEARTLFENDFDAPAYENYREFLQDLGDDLDAVTIVTPHTLHYEQAMACLQRGIPVLLEKPMVTNIAHGVDLVETAAERDVVLQVGYQRHFHPAFREIRRILQTGRIGDLHAVNCYLGQDWIDLHRDTWRGDPSLSGGGQLYDTGQHLLDALLWTTGTDPKKVSAQIDYDKPRVDVNSSLAMLLERGEESVIGSVGISGDGVEITPAEGYFYWGTKGRISYFGNRITVAEKDAVTYQTDITEGMDFQTLNRKKIENFINSIRGTEEAAVPGEVGLQVTALTEAAYRAADTESTVTVQSLIDEAIAERV